MLATAPPLPFSLGAQHFWGGDGVSGALPSPTKIHHGSQLSIREKSPNLFLKHFLPRYLPFAKPELQPRNLTTINETQQGHKRPNTVTLKLFQPALATQIQTQGSKRTANTQPFPSGSPLGPQISPSQGWRSLSLADPQEHSRYLPFESSRQLRPNQHHSKKGKKTPTKNLQKWHYS